MATGHKKQYVVVGIALLLAGIACANPLPQRQAASATALSTPTLPTPPITTACRYYVGVDNLNFRTGPGTRFPIWLVLHKGEELHNPVNMGTWTQAEVYRLGSRYSGYVNSEYVGECR